jgi:integrase
MRITGTLATLIRNYRQNDRPVAATKRRPRASDVNYALTENGRYRRVGAKGRGVEGAKLSANDRRRALVNGQPALLFLDTTGKPLEPAVWDARLTEANKRLAEAGWDLHVTSHDLRHTYAVHRLDHLVRKAAAKAEIEAPRPGSAAWSIMAATQPLHQLQIELGHSRFTSTLRYLTPDLDPSEFRWAQQLLNEELAQ